MFINSNQFLIKQVNYVFSVPKSSPASDLRATHLQDTNFVFSLWGSIFCYS